MRRFVLAAAALGLTASAAGAAPKAGTPASQNVLKQGLQAVVAPLVAENDVGQASVIQASAKGNSKSQGAEHASPTAIMKVCSHDNPSAQRSAICPHPISPD
jgi:hypothetical protein